jgi:hypothetical protein
MQGFNLASAYGDARVTLLDDKHLLAAIDSFEFDGVKFKCSLQGYLADGVWCHNSETMFLEHCATGMKVFGVAAERVASLVMAEIASFLRTRVDLLERAWSDSRQQRAEQILAEIAKHEGKISQLRQELRLLKEAKRGEDR